MQGWQATSSCVSRLTEKAFALSIPFAENSLQWSLRWSGESDASDLFFDRPSNPKSGLQHGFVDLRICQLQPTLPVCLRPGPQICVHSLCTWSTSHVSCQMRDSDRTLWHDSSEPNHGPRLRRGVFLSRLSSQEWTGPYCDIRIGINQNLTDIKPRREVRQSTNIQLSLACLPLNRASIKATSACWAKLAL